MRSLVGVSIILRTVDGRCRVGISDNPRPVCRVLRPRSDGLPQSVLGNPFFAWICPSPTHQSGDNARSRAKSRGIHRLEFLALLNQNAGKINSRRVVEQNDPCCADFSQSWNGIIWLCGPFHGVVSLFTVWRRPAPSNCFYLLEVRVRLRQPCIVHSTYPLT